MGRVIFGLILTCSLGLTASGFEEPTGLLDRALTRMRIELKSLPDFVCSQTVERFSRSAADRAWEKSDTIRFEVAVVGDRELYSRPGEHQFQNRQLAEIAGKGTIGSGQFANLAKHVFLPSAVQFNYKGETEQNGRRAHEYEYEVAHGNSSYRLRSGTAESVVGFQGSIWVDAETADLIRLDVQAFDIPDHLGLAEANTSVSYTRTTIDGVEILLPASAKLSAVAADGIEHLNRTRMDGCRHYRTESAIRFDNSAVSKNDIPGKATAASTLDFAIPVGTVVELVLEAGLDPEKASVGDVIKGTVARLVKVGDRVLVPQGALVSGHVVRVEKQTRPFPMYEIGLEFNSLNLAGGAVSFVATMEDVGPASGVIRQAKHLDPTFTRQRTARLDILVREVQRGQGIVSWDARKGPIPRGLKMRWRVDKEPEAEAARVEGVRP